MARLLAAASSQYLSSAAAAVDPLPYTMSIWFNTSNNTVVQALTWIGVSGTANSFSYLLLRGDVAGDPIEAAYRDSAAVTATARSTSGFSLNTWHHACGVFTSTASRSVYIDGGSSATNTSALTTQSTKNTTEIGRYNPGNIQYFSGLIAEGAMWSAALDADEVAALAKGISPRMIRPGALESYWPLIGRYSPEIDLRGLTPMTLNNTPTVGDHPRIYYPSTSQSGKYSAPIVTGRMLVHPGMVGMTGLQGLDGRCNA